MTDLAPILFDFAATKRAHARTEGDGGFLFSEVGERLLERLGDVNRHFGNVLEIGTRTPGLKAALGADNHVVVPATETLDASFADFDLVISNLSLHAVNDLPGLLVQINHALRPDGLFLASLFGGETLSSLRRAWMAAEADILGGVTPRVAPFADVRDLGGLLQRGGFALPVADLDRIDVSWETSFGLFKDLRAMGETNQLADRPRGLTTPRLLAAVAEAYAVENRDAEGRVNATFDIVFLTGWAPHPDQPQAKRPGSATASLAEALGTVEKKV